MDSPQPWHQAPAVSRSSQFRAGSGKLELENHFLDPPCSWGWWRRRSSWWCAPWSCSSRWTCWSRPGRRCWDRSQQVIQGTSCRMNSFDTQHSHRDQKNRFLLIKIYSGKNSKIEATHLHSLPRLLLRLESLYQDRQTTTNLWDAVNYPTCLLLLALKELLEDLCMTSNELLR